jgi:hypothetical protein
MSPFVAQTKKKGLPKNAFYFDALLITNMERKTIQKNFTRIPEYKRKKIFDVLFPFLFFLKPKISLKKARLYQCLSIKEVLLLNETSNKSSSQLTCYLFRR